MALKNKYPPINHGQRGQAAVTDAIYFLMVVSFLSIFLFSFSNSYGNSVMEKISNEYSTAFATGALKTILYSSTPRDKSESVYQITQGSEIDYLLAILKEDYADDAKINGEERKVLSKTIRSVMRPVADTKDYIFFITIPTVNQANLEGDFVYVFVHTTNFVEDTSALQGEKVPRSYLLMKPGEPHHLDYFCGIRQGGGSTPVTGPGYGDMLKNISRLLANVGPTSQASSQVKLMQSATSPGDLPRNFKAQADLALWDATWLGQTSERTVEIFDNVSWGCVAAD